MFGEETVSELNKIPLSDNTISRCIEDMSGNIECNIKSKILKHELFALQVDGSTDITTNGQDVFDVLNSFMFGLLWIELQNCRGICADGAPAMTGCLKGFVPIAQKQNSNIMHAHCFIYREALVAKTLGTELKSTLDMVVKIVNYVKMSPLKRRLFRKL